MFDKKKNFIYKLSAIVFILLLLTPCTIKSDIKLSLNISTTSTNKDRITTNSCSQFSTNERNVQTTSQILVLQNDSDKLFRSDTPTLPCPKTLVLEKSRVIDNVCFYTIPIFLHFRELII